MDGIKFLDDSDIKTLFDENAETDAGFTGSSETEKKPEDNIKEVSDSDLGNYFFDNDQSKEHEEKQVEDRKKPLESEVNYSDIAKQLGLEGEATDIESLRNLIEEKISNGIDDDTKRVKEALEYGVDAKDIQEFEQTLEYLHSITNDILIQETEESDNVRKRLILQDYLNRGVDEKEAVDEVKKIFKEGRDIEAAKSALASNKKYFQTEYQKMIDDAKEEADMYKSHIDKQTEELKNSIMKNGFMNIDVSDKLKDKAFRNISDPIYKDPETGNQITAIQKYQRENPIDFLRNLSLIYTLTDGFKNMDQIINPIVSKKMSNQIAGVEDLLKNPSSSDSNLRMVTSESTSNSGRFKFGI